MYAPCVHIVCTWISEDSLWGLVLSFHHVGPENQTRVLELGSTPLVLSCHSCVSLCCNTVPALAPKEVGACVDVTLVLRLYNTCSLSLPSSFQMCKEQQILAFENRADFSTLVKVDQGGGRSRKCPLQRQGPTLLLLGAPLLRRSGRREESHC